MMDVVDQVPDAAERRRPGRSCSRSWCGPPVVWF